MSDSEKKTIRSDLKKIKIKNNPQQMDDACLRAKEYWHSDNHLSLFVYS